MSKRKKDTKLKQLPFGRKLILLQWIVSLFGFDPLPDRKDGDGTRQSIEPLVSMLKETPDGMTADNVHYFYKVLNDHLKTKAQITHADLLRYEHNIVSHTIAINEMRERPIVWKYFQWLSLLFVEIYLDRFFRDSDALREQLNAYVREFNNYWRMQDIETGITPYTFQDLNKLCLQNATGSGKTLLMNVNFLQFKSYVSKSKMKNDLTRTVLITPNEALSEQHKREMKASGIVAERLGTDGGDLLTKSNLGLKQVDYTEVTKLGDEDGPNTIAVRNLSDQNLLLVDEAHRGMGSQEERGWFNSRARLSANGFVFEYSATFKEAITATKRPEIEIAYAKTILFDYSYRYFYEDGYGKDYRIFNLPSAYEDLQFSYLTACLLSFFQQLKLYEDKATEYAPYNIEKPLWVFVGTTVTKAKGTKAEKATVSDIGKIIAFLAKFLKNRIVTVRTIHELLTNTAQQTGLLDENGGDIFAGTFLYLQNLLTKKGWNIEDLLTDIYRTLFKSVSGGQLSIARVRGDSNEIMLRVGQADVPFGLINVGDAKGLTVHIMEQQFENVTVLDSEFSNPLFGTIESAISPLNLLIGSKKFIEGWDCWRVSTLGLMHVGKSEGAQIIQLFGRGVRLKGYDWTLKRSGFANPGRQPEFIQYVETLNVFGIEADFISKFRSFLNEEGLPTQDLMHVVTVPLDITYDFARKLKTVRPRRKPSAKREFDFRRDGATLTLGDVPPKIREKIIEIDWYPRIQSMESKTKLRLGNKESTVFSESHLRMLDYDDLYFRIEKMKGERTWFNINVQKSRLFDLLYDTTWYRLVIPTGKMRFDSFLNVRLWQEMATELLMKYAEEYFNYSRAAFIEPRLEVREIEPNDGNFPKSEEYQLIVNVNEAALINDINNFTKEILANTPGILKAGELKGCRLGNHLYEPVLHVAKGSKIHIAPASLNESEFQFIDDLRKFVERERERLVDEKTEIFLLRNESRGRGVGFFEADNFFPDFILWQVKDGVQYLSFVEPHGLQHEGPGHKKIEFHKVIKTIQHRLADKNLILNSYVITPTRFSSLKWGKTIKELEDMHVLFMYDQPEVYLAKIVKSMVN